MIRRIPVLLAAAFASASLLTACGSSDALDGKDAAGVLKETFGPDHPVKSGRLDLSLRFQANGLQGLDGPINARLSGPFQSQGGKTLPAFDFDLTLDAGGQAFTAGAVSTGEKGFISIAGQNYDVGKDLYDSFKTGYESASKDAEKTDGPTFTSLGIQPLRWLKNATKKGEEEVGGTQTVHVSATVDVQKLLADIDTLLKKAGNVAVPGTNEKVPSGLTATQRGVITDAVKSSVFDVWAGKADGTLRRLRVAVAFSVPAEAQKSAGGLKDGTLVIDLAIGNLNKDQTITPPKTSQPLSDLTAAVQGQAGAGSATGSTGTGAGSGSSGAGSGSSGAGSGATGGTGTPQSTGSPYLDCLATAGDDLVKVQQCAEKLGK